MLRLGIEYDFLPRESEILHLKFWEAAFEQLKKTGVLYFETEGKNKGCWVMRRPGAAVAEGDVDEDAKVIVRSNGTVTYVGKDIAYHLWKFGLLGRDFGYKPFFAYDDRECWISASRAGKKHPHFGGAQAIYNVIDSRQADPQANVIQALRGMGYTEQADRYTHFGYEMVALTPSYAAQLGYQLSEEDRARPYIEISGRKGFGVKADDLMDLMIAAAKSEVVKRHADWDDARITAVASTIAYGALRYYMLRFTRNSVIAFDQDMALSPEGETGPYLMYAAARIRSIFRKGGTTPEAVLAELAALAELDRGGADCEVSERRRQRGHLGALAAGRPPHHGAGAMHCHVRSPRIWPTCISAGPGLQQLLSPSPHPHRGRSGAENIPAGNCGSGSARTGDGAGVAGHRKPRSDVEQHSVVSFSFQPLSTRCVPRARRRLRPHMAYPPLRERNAPCARSSGRGRESR